MGISDADTKLRDKQWQWWLCTIHIGLYAAMFLTVPAVTIERIELTSATSITIHWTNPMTTEPITGYAVEYRAVSVPPGAYNRTMIDGVTTQHVIGGLSAYSPYTQVHSPSWLLRVQLYKLQVLNFTCRVSSCHTSGLHSLAEEYELRVQIFIGGNPGGVSESRCFKPGGGKWTNQQWGWTGAWRSLTTCMCNYPLNWEVSPITYLTTLCNVYHFVGEVDPIVAMGQWPDTDLECQWSVPHHHHRVWGGTNSITVTSKVLTRLSYICCFVFTDVCVYIYYTHIYCMYVSVGHMWLLSVYLCYHSLMACRLLSYGIMFLLSSSSRSTAQHCHLPCVCWWQWCDHS